MSKPINQKCYWCDVRKKECRALEEDVCRTRGCSFFETTRGFLDRQRAFLKRTHAR